MNLTDTLVPAALGLGTGMSLIVAIGAQNSYILRYSVSARARSIAIIVLVCIISDAILISAGVLGIGGLVQRFPVALVVVRFAGAAFLAGYGLLAAKRALRPTKTATNESKIPGTTTTTALLTVLALTWLNPHVYLDTVLLLGSVANQQGLNERWWFAGGALVASVLWFSALGFGALLLRSVFARPNAWRILDGAIAILMFALALRLALTN